MAKIFYVDGACKGNPGSGGYGVIGFNEKNEIVYVYNETCEKTTNNREELKAILHAFELSQRNENINKDCIIYSDSAYSVNMINNWIHTWATNNWKNSKKQTVENIDLVKEIYKYLNINFFNCQVVKCNGHDGIIGNELADALATNNLNKFNKIVEKNDIKIEE